MFFPPLREKGEYDVSINPFSFSLPPFTKVNGAHFIHPYFGRMKNGFAWKPVWLTRDDTRTISRYPKWIEFMIAFIALDKRHR